MCGIVGYWNPSTEDPQGIIRKMTAAISHRGPDSDGYWIDDDAGLAIGHRRLSILDLSPSGAQPMLSDSGRYLIAFNGEIYNFVDLRRELEHSGVRFRGSSDTEVVLAAFEAWGIESSLQRFVGMFAIALWDRNERHLYLIRDRLGEKPLYYGWSGGTLLFGSELKAIRQHPSWCADISRDALGLMLRQSCVPGPYSIYKGVFKLPPGSYIRLTDSRTQGTPRVYWSLEGAIAFGADRPLSGDPADAIDQLEALLKDAVAKQMVADVPLGAFLSGGVDSSTVVALMQAQSSRRVKTFTIGFNEGGYNEATHAEAIARHLGTDHTGLYVTAQDALNVIPKLPHLYDEPFSDPSQIPTFLVAQLAKRDVSVALSGDGGDELFGGYNRYIWGPKLWSRLNGVPFAARRVASKCLHSIPPGAWDQAFRTCNRILPTRLQQVSAGDKFHKLADILALGSQEAVYQGLTGHWDPLSVVVPNASEPGVDLADPRRTVPVREFANRMMYWDTLGYLPDDILVKVDRAAMGVSLESRVPLLDHRVVEFAWRLPLEWKIRNSQGKWALRQVLYRYVPREMVERPKSGFAIPIDSWLRGPLREWAHSLLDERSIRNDGLLAPEPILTRWHEHLSGRRNWQYYIWDVLMFQAWFAEQRRSARSLS